ncbi:MAG TPA: lysophospholipid acyltransferase family protein [Thermoanaerobaculia bacterium]|nr:lysophospholipid acyltransferase family protein [Thermoanaerobaculia bacterium]
MTLVAWVIARTPLAVAAGFSRFAAWLWWLVVPIRKSLAVRNFRSAFPGVAPGPPLRRMMAGLVLGYFELLHEERVPGSVALTIGGTAAIAERQNTGKGTLIVAAHLGSWDLVGALMARRTGFRASAVVKIPRSKPVAALIERVRTAYGLGFVPNKTGAMKRALELLDEGQLVVFIIDQRFARGVDVPFFGRPALTSPAICVAAERTGCAVSFLEFWRESDASHGAAFSEPFLLTHREEEDLAALTARIEEAVRRRPHNWLWLHDRWKHVPRRDPRQA